MICEVIKSFSCTSLAESALASSAVQVIVTIPILRVTGTSSSPPSASRCVLSGTIPSSSTQVTFGSVTLCGSVAVASN